jgi:hypothetical protein
MRCRNIQRDFCVVAFFGFTAAADFKAWRTSSRFPWLEAIARPIVISILAVRRGKAERGIAPAA